MVTLPASGVVIAQVLATSRACSVFPVATPPPVIVPLTLPVPLSVNASVLVPPVKLPIPVKAATLVTLPASGVVIAQVLATSRACSVLPVATPPPVIVPLTVPVPLSVNASVLVPPVRLFAPEKVSTFVFSVSVPAFGVVIAQVLAKFAPCSVFTVPAGIDTTSMFENPPVTLASAPANPFAPEVALIVTERAVV